MSKKKKRIIIIAIVLLLCIAVTTTVVLVIRNSGREQKSQLAGNGDIHTEEQTEDMNAGHDTSENVTLSSNITEGKTESAEGNTEEARKPTTESGSTADDSKPTGGTSNNNVPPTTEQPTTQAPITQTPTSQTPNPTEQPSGGNQGSGDGGNTHQHTWEAQYRTVHHEEEGHYENVCVQEAYDEPVYETHNFCNYCGIDITATGVGVGHCVACGPALSEDDIRYVPGIITTAGSSYGTKDVQVDTIHHEAVYEKKWIVDKKAYDEQVPNGYQCTTCGATK